MNRSTSIKVGVGVASLIVVFVLFLFYWTSTGSRWQPLTVTGQLYLTSGGDPPTIHPGDTLRFNAQTYCNSLRHPLSVQVRIVFVSTATPPKDEVVLSAATVATFQPGCTIGKGISLDPPDPLAPGLWELQLTFTAVDQGHTQIVREVSTQFMAVP